MSEYYIHVETEAKTPYKQFLPARVDLSPLCMCDESAREGLG